jgi:hypothetical protein
LTPCWASIATWPQPRHSSAPPATALCSISAVQAQFSRSYRPPRPVALQTTPKPLARNLTKPSRSATI